MRLVMEIRIVMLTFLIGSVIWEHDTVYIFALFYFIEINLTVRNQLLAKNFFKYEKSDSSIK